MKSSGFISSGGLDLFIIWVEDFTKSPRSWRSGGGISAPDRYAAMLFSAWVCFVARGAFWKGLNAYCCCQPHSKSIPASYQRSAYVFKKMPGIKQPSEWPSHACPCPHFVTSSSGSHQDQTVTAPRDGSSDGPVCGCVPLLLSYRRVRPLWQVNLVATNPQLWGYV